MCKSRYFVALCRLLTISIIAINFSACEARLRNKGSALIGDVELFGTNGSTPRRMFTLGELDSVLHSEHHYYSQSSRTRNRVAVNWWGELVRAGFYVPGATDQKEVGQAAIPFELYIVPPFKGSILGVHLGDSHDQVISILKLARYNTARLTDGYSSWNFCVPADKTYDFCWQEDKSHKVVGMSLKNPNIIALPGSK